MNCAAAMTAPAAVTFQCRPVMSQIRPKVDSVNWGTTSSADSRWMRVRNRLSRYGLNGRSPSAAGLAARPGRVGDADGAGGGEDRGERARQQQRRPDAKPAGQRRDGQRGDGHAERLRDLPDAHRQAPAGAGKPADHHPPGRGAGAGRGRAAEHEQDPEADVAGHRRRREGEHGGEREAAGDHPPLPVPVGHRAPGDQRHDHADGRGGGQQPGLGQRHAAVEVQQRDQVGGRAQEQASGRLRADPEGEHPPRRGRVSGTRSRVGVVLMAMPAFLPMEYRLAIPYWYTNVEVT